MVIIPDEFPVGAPNPPPWIVHYFNEENGMSRPVLPEARTNGLSAYGVPELQIRLISPTLAAPILDRLGVWMVYEKQRLTDGMVIQLQDRVFHLVEFDESVLRLCWENDPR